VSPSKKLQVVSRQAQEEVSDGGIRSLSHS
jgi:hypothetical protein